VRYIDAIRQRLSPQTKTDTNELGVILASDEAEIAESKAHPDTIPALYWNAAGALYAYLYAELAKQSIDVIGESQLVGYPSQFHQLVATTLSRRSDIAAQGFVTSAGKELLLLNKRSRVIDVTLPEGAQNAKLLTVDEASGEGAARVSRQEGTHLNLAPFAVVVVSVP
jgi:hypothetical protein